MDARTHRQSVLSSNEVSSLDLFRDPLGIAIDRRGRVVVADNNAFAPDLGSDGGLILVDPRTGEESVLVDGTAPGALIDEPDGLAFSPAGFLGVADFDAGSGHDGALIKVDPRTGAQSLIADNGTSSADLFSDPTGVAFLRSGKPVVAEQSGPPAGDTGLIGVLQAGGELTALSLDDQFREPYSVIALPSGRLVAVDDSAFPSGPKAGALIAVSPRTGKQTVISNNQISGPDLFVEPTGIARELRGSYAVADEPAGLIIRVNQRTGAESVLASNALPGPDLLAGPFDLTVVPPRCGGQFATIYGGPKADVLKGTRFPDVIAGLGGRDRIRGLGAKDRICGGKGRDSLSGGAGRDLLVGGPGRDSARQ